ncbi:nuclear factor interleukin-3-regulated protein [Parasteatoda tepidariorum]|uniref:nuclear factor interleukin-3-regulated protein n=1 Tax=Parasteatoda tepidariorum TaxID=114398 RepID=UPI00077FB60F|nr:nuclear factor interleukin-3-regulated protein [Parasteatoda tepidariorum]XP_015910475.1 nuclear factor interleukin-3-regulated protein [Parasteatoda tepidariorum]
MMMITANDSTGSKHRIQDLRPNSPPYSPPLSNSGHPHYSPLSPGSNSMSPNPYQSPNSDSGRPIWSNNMEAPVDLTAALKGNKEIFPARKQREFIPDNKKDESYWDRRRRNNEAAKRSREKRRLNDMVLETRMLELTKENTLLRAELTAIREKFSLPPTPIVNSEQLHLHIPCPQIDVRSRRSKLLTTLLPNGSPLQPESGMLPHGMNHSPGAHAPDHSMHHMMSHLHAMDHAQWQEAHENAMKESHHQAMLLKNHQQQQQLHQHVINRLTSNNGMAPGEYDYRGNLNVRSPPQEVPSPTSASPHHDESSSWSSTEEPIHARPVSPQHCLPHKLRHKSLISDKDAFIQVPSYPDSGRSSGRDDTSSDGDSGGKESPVPNSDSPQNSEEPPRKVARLSRRGKGMGAELQVENLHLRFELKKLASEVAGLKDMLLCNRPPSLELQTPIEPTTPPHSNRTSPNIIEPYDAVSK